MNGGVTIEDTSSGPLIDIDQGRGKVIAGGIDGREFLRTGTEVPLVVKVTLSGEPEIASVLPTQNADGSMIFNAAEAEVQGSSAHLEDAKKAIGFWTDANDVVLWNFNATKPGTYKLTAEIACDKDSAGSLVSARFEDQEQQFVVKSTGDWSKFETVDLGTFTIRKTGPAKISIKARMKPGYAVMNLRSVKLTPNAR